MIKDVTTQSYHKVSEVAELIGKSGQTIKRWRTDGKIPFGRKLKSSGHIVFTDDEVEIIRRFASETV